MPSGTLPAPIKALHTHTISLAYPTAVSAYGDVTYGTPVEAAARVSEEERVVWSGERQERTTATRVCTASEITPQTRIWLPGDSSATASLARLPRGNVEQRHGEDGALWAYVAWV